MSNGSLKGMVLTGLACFVAGGLTGYWLKPSAVPPQAADAVAAGAAGEASEASGATMPWPSAHGLGGLKLTEVVADHEGGGYLAWVQDADGLSSQYSVGDMLPGDYEIRAISSDRLIAARDGQDHVLALTPDAGAAMATEDGKVASEELLAQAVVRQMVDSSQKMVEQMRKTQDKTPPADEGRP